MRDFVVEDAASVSHLLDEMWGADPVFRQIYDQHGAFRGDPLRLTLVAEHDHEVVAVASAAAGERHPSRLWLAIHVRRDLRRLGVGSELLQQLRRQIKDPRPFRVTAPLAHDASVQFLLRHGLQLRNRCHEGRIDPFDESLSAALEPFVSAADRVRIETTATTRERDPLQRAARFPADWYAGTHRWDPPAPWSPAAAAEHFCGELLVPDSLVFAYQGDRLVGAGAFIRSPWDADAEDLYLNQVGTAEVDGDSACAVGATLLDALLCYARDRERQIEFEIDEANASLWRVVEALPIGPTRVIGNFSEGRHGRVTAPEHSRTPAQRSGT